MRRSDKNDAVHGKKESNREMWQVCIYIVVKNTGPL